MLEDTQSSRAKALLQAMEPDLVGTNEKLICDAFSSQGKLKEFRTYTISIWKFLVVLS